jgi:hypothetical protein
MLFKFLQGPWQIWIEVKMYNQLASIVQAEKLGNMEIHS